MTRRRPRLIHLSHEHRSAMKLALAVRELLPEDESALPDVAERIRQVFESDLLPHFIEEEKHVIPRLIEIGHSDFADRMNAEHEELKALVEALKSPSTAGIESFADALRRHVEFEEEIAWEAIEQADALSDAEPATAGAHH